MSVKEKIFNERDAVIPNNAEVHKGPCVSIKFSGKISLDIKSILKKFDI